MFVQSFKKSMLAMTGKEDINLKICNLHMAYRIAPHSTTGFGPSDLMLGRPIRTKLDLLKPEVEREIVAKQSQFMENRMKEICEFSIGQEVFARNYCGEMKWRKEVILICEGPYINPR